MALVPGPLWACCCERGSPKRSGRRLVERGDKNPGVKYSPDSNSAKTPETRRRADDRGDLGQSPILPVDSTPTTNAETVKAIRSKSIDPREIIAPATMQAKHAGTRTRVVKVRGLRTMGEFPSASCRTAKLQPCHCTTYAVT
jgi:hypothetical protein